jgi:hypothetical protein
VTIVNIRDLAGDFAENKDIAAGIRRETIEPELAKGKQVVLNFAGVDLTTQSFIHALISNALRQRGEIALELMEFKKCSKLVRGIVETVVQYSLETVE